MCTPGIVKSCKTKCTLYKTFIRNPTEIYKRNYVTHINNLSHVIRLLSSNITLLFSVIIMLEKPAPTSNQLKKKHKIKNLIEEIFF